MVKIRLKLLRKITGKKNKKQKATNRQGKSMITLRKEGD